ncbi:hypothetical protein [Haloplanus sp. C73]|uniref:hypothetical protein n=1 Tax=Haloplanus sp. C73 TaxID=3421641 RepID=UPI003EBECE27
MTSSSPFKRIEGGVCWYFEGEDADIKCRHEGAIELYPDWIRLGGPIPNWIPRERVEQVHER